MEPRRKSQDPLHKRSGASQAGEYAGVGLQFAGAILIFLFLGIKLDEWLGTEPWFLILGVFVGSAGGFWAMYRRLVIDPREREKREKRG